MLLILFHTIINHARIQRGSSGSGTPWKTSSSKGSLWEGGTLVFSSYVGSYPASTVHPQKYQEFQAPQKNI